MMTVSFMLFVICSLFVEMLFIVAAVIFMVVIGVTIRVAYVLQTIRTTRSTTPSMLHYALPKKARVSVMAVLGSGGHTKEMLALLSQLVCEKFSPRSYVIANTDKFSHDKVVRLQEELDDDQFVVMTVPRSREVNQSYISSVFTTLLAAVRSLPLVIERKPDVLLCNGPGTCVPICVWTFLLRVFGFYDMKIVFIESICRVRTLSLSGKLLYFFADHFIVLWPDLREKYPYTSYIGRLF